jgi:hypothetical protein
LFAHSFVPPVPPELKAGVLEKSPKTPKALGDGKQNFEKPPDNPKRALTTPARKLFFKPSSHEDLAW